MIRYIKLKDWKGAPMREVLVEIKARPRLSRASKRPTPSDLSRLSEAEPGAVDRRARKPPSI